MNTLPTIHQALLQTYREHLENVRKCIEQNYNVIKLILKDVGYIFENIDPEETNPRMVCITVQLIHINVSLKTNFSAILIAALEFMILFLLILD